ncbi:hypothetical protein DL768_002678 [Monosporascus sp. mg162]|nr:hypothetical protein DL768_002678 [Monosporascus sp. mg162]
MRRMHCVRYTLQRISASSQSLHGDEQAEGHTPSLGAGLVGTDPVSHQYSDREELINFLAIFQERLYPVWPIVDVAPLISDLSKERTDPRAHILADSIRLATAAQLRRDTSASLDALSTRLATCDHQMDLTSVQTSFFLHIIHENETPGGTKSLIYLRQAITVAQMMRLDRESSYTSLPETEQQMRRRILWLLYVTERGVALLHRLPVILKPTTLFPFPQDDTHVLPAFLELVHLFWIFDQSRIFEILEDADCNGPTVPMAQRCLDILQDTLQEHSTNFEPSNYVQKADLFVTRQWMRTVVWRAAASLGLRAAALNPVRIGKEFLSFVSQLPREAIESHGPTIEYKTYDIATAVVDSVSNNSPDASSARQVLGGLQRLLSSSRRENKQLLASLCLKISSIPITLHPSFPLENGQHVEEVRDQGGHQSADNSNELLTMHNPLAWVDLHGILANAGRFPESTDNQFTSVDHGDLSNSWQPLGYNMPFSFAYSALAASAIDQDQTAAEDPMNAHNIPWDEHVP